MAGGVALNCVANGYLHRSNLFKDIFIQPAAGDAGGALGAAQAVHYMYYKQERDLTRDTDIMQGAYLGPDFSDKEIIMILKKYKAAYKKARTVGELCNEVADLLYRGKVIGWFQGRMEYGPRALGNRSILADARNPEMQKKLNLKIKYREGFRPFAPSVLMEDLQDFFELKVPTPYMLLVANVKKQLRKPLPENYEKLDLLDKLYLARSDIPAVTHLDFSARIQTVHRETNPRYWLLLKTFKEKTGCGVCVNTSFNVRGEPIVCTPEDAYKCFMRTEMDCLVMNDFILNKKQQRNRDDKDRWSIYFNPD